MLDYHLSQEELAESRTAYRTARDAREAHLFNDVILLGSG